MYGSKNMQAAATTKQQQHDDVDGDEEIPNRLVNKRCSAEEKHPVSAQNEVTS